MNASPHVGFSPETGEDEPFRTTSRLAIAAVAAAFLSPVAMIHPLLAVAPLAAAVLALLALFTMSKEQVGRTAALCALVPGIAFGTFGPTRYFSRQQNIFLSAEHFSDQWLQLLSEGRKFEAHQLTLTAYERQPLDVSLDEYYADPFQQIDGIPTEEQLHGPFVDLQEFMAQDPLLYVLEWPDGFDAERLDIFESLRGTTESETVSLTYRLTGKGSAEGEVASITVVMQRFVRDSVAYWRVLEFSEPRSST